MFFFFLNIISLLKAQHYNAKSFLSTFAARYSVSHFAYAYEIDKN